jgi:hypothetical protein
MFSDSGDACSHPSLMIAACCLSFVLVFIPRDILGIKASSRVIVAWMAKVRSPMLSLQNEWRDGLRKRDSPSKCLHFARFYP